MARKNVIFEDEIVFYDKKFFKDDKEHCYDVECFNGFAIGKLADKEDTTAPQRIFITYPKREYVVRHKKLAEEVLCYRGLDELQPRDITYGDIMLCCGEIQQEHVEK